MIVQMVNLIRRNLLKFTNNFIQVEKLIAFASKILSFQEEYIERLILFLRYAFDTFDADHNGTIDFEEFLLAVSATSQGDLDERLSVAFDM